MALPSLEKLIETYSEWSSPVADTDDWQEISEQIDADITAITGEDPSVQAYTAAKSPLVSICLFFMFSFVVVLMVPDFGVLGLVLCWGLVATSLWLLDGRPIFLSELGDQRYTQNRTLTKHGGRHLIVVTASLASTAPLRGFEKLDTGTLRLIRLISGGVAPVLATLSGFTSSYLIIAAFASLVVCFATTLLLHRDSILLHWPLLTPQISSVIGAMMLTERLMRETPLDCEIKLILTGGGYDPRTGWRTMMLDRKEDFDARPVTVVGFEGLGGHKVNLVREIGAGLPRSFVGPLSTAIAKSADKGQGTIGLSNIDHSLSWLHPLTGRRFDIALLSGDGSAGAQKDGLDTRSIAVAVEAAEQGIRMLFER